MELNRKRLSGILEQVRDGELSVEGACEKFKDLHVEDLGFASLDHHRAVRLGFPEVIYGEGKTSDQITGIFRSLIQRQDVVLATRVDPDKAARVMKDVSDLEHNPLARTLVYRKTPPAMSVDGLILVVAAGTSDLPVAEEAKVTAQAFGANVETVYDVGIAGIHRLFTHHEKLRSASVIIVVAGMEGALPSVVGGLVDKPVIATPTSVGYGASFGGIAALLGMLNSCAPGVLVVNIDNGFGAAYAACMIMRSGSRSSMNAYKLK